MHKKRLAVLRELQLLGYRCTFLQGVYDPERTLMLRRSKLVLNVHYYDSRITETNRLFAALLAGSVVISEHGTDDTPWRRAVVFVSYSELVSTCDKYLRQPQLQETKRAAALSALMDAKYLEALHALFKLSMQRDSM